MADTDVTIYYNIHRLQALKDVLRIQGSDVQTAVSATLDSLYEKYVPAQDRQDIENRIAQEAAQARAEAEAARRYSVLRLKQGGDVFCLLDSEHINLYSLARLYRVSLQPKLADKSLWNVLGSFTKADRIFQSDYNRLADHIGVNPQITMVAEMDLDKGTLHYRDTGMDTYVGYSLKDLSTAVFRADRKYGLRQSVRDEIFCNALDGKELEPVDAPAEELDTGPAMQM